MTCGRRDVVRLLERSFLGELELDEHRELKAHLAACEPCREQYDRQTLAERALHREPPPLPESHLDLVGQAVVAQVAAQPKPQRTRWWLALLAPAAALSLLLAYLAARPEDPFQARSSPATPVEGVRVFCVDPGPEPHVRATSDLRPGQTLRCKATDLLQFSYTTGNEAVHLSVVSLPEAGEGEALHYLNPDAGFASVALPANAHDVPFEYSVRPTRHVPEQRRLVALFSTRPLTFEEVETRARAFVADAGVDPDVRAAHAATFVLDP